MKQNFVRRSSLAAAAILAVWSASPVFAATATQIEAELASSDLVVADLAVEEVEGMMIIRGKVGAQADGTEAENFVRARTKRPVISAIEVIPRPDDATIERQVERALHLNENLADATISVSTRRGIVELTGTVENELQIKAAEDTVTTVRDVLRIRNLLRVRS